MARQLGVSPAYINLLENNQRSLSVKVLLRLSEAYGVDWRKLVNARGMTAELLVSSPESAIHDFFRDHSNHFASLEDAADSAREAIGRRPDDFFSNLKRHLDNAYGITVRVVGLDEMSNTLRIFDAEKNRVLLSEAMDPINRNFQLAHVLALVSCSNLLDSLTADAGTLTDAGKARCRVELANYFSAAFLMPYGPTLELAESTGYDIDRITATFSVSFEMACHRLTTLQRKGAEGVPFFFLRTDHAEKVTKRFNATPFTFAEQGGACPVWTIHSAFVSPDVIIPQFVELPDAGQFFTISRTTDRPVTSRLTQGRRLAVALGCGREHADRVGYAAPLSGEESDTVARTWINFHICPRHACSQRAHEPLRVNLPFNANRRGSTRYES